MDHSKHSSTEQSPWELLVESTFDRPERKISVAHKTPSAGEAKPSPRRKKWLWAILAAVVVVVIAVACILPSFFGKDESLSIPDELIPCKEALDQWQSLDSYQITRQFNYYGNMTGILGGQNYEEYTRSGDDWMQLEYWTDFTAGQMYRDGILYSRNTAFNGLNWEPSNDALEQPKNWPMVFSWENCDLTHKITKETESGKHIIFGVAEKDPEQAYYAASPYHVCFSFDTNGQLESISVARVGSDNVSDMLLSVSTYRLVSDDAEAIAQYISEQFVGADITTED